ncbi:DNA-directed RNA polymerase III subunit RPC3 [Perkinsela sp. CCAP 1560/4]|nr:DNA-directed RNA polymerase III subunit RPC3 [Perkinsela sp. CCAP 1560/4]|eukprot:KNH05276.1 DNA-directed RNA polymerase III subunit RPC3 [Perkinsela sp. CCAP 1560/4]
MSEVIKTTLALEIVSAHFGSEIGSFAKFITEKIVPVSIHEVLSSSEFSKEFSISSMGTLFQHNLLRIHEKQEARKIEFSSIRAIFRLLFPWFLQVFEHHYGKLGAEIATLFMTQGRMSEMGFRAQLTSASHSRSDEWKKSMYDAFRSIIEAEKPFIVSVVAASPWDAIKDDADPAILPEDGPASKRPKSDNHIDQIASKDLVYTIDITQILFHLRSSELLSYLKAKFTDDLVPEIHKALLQHDHPEITEVESASRFRPFKQITTPLSVAALSNALEKGNVKIEILLSSLDLEVSGGYMKKVPGADAEAAMYSLQTGMIINEVREELVFKALSSRFGLEGVRIFRLLLRHQCADEMTISDACKISPESARSCLFELQSMGFAQAQCISGSPKDVFLWSPNVTTALDQLLFGVLKTLRILFSRLHSILDKTDEVACGVSSQTDEADRRLAHAINEAAVMFLRLDVF